MGNRILKLQGSIIIKNIGETGRNLLKYIDEGDSTGVDISDIEEVDLSLIQLLCSAHRYSVKNGKEFYLVANDSQIFHDAIEVGGFNILCECARPNKPGCLWKFNAVL